mmetsp:Transcript_12867/g.28358  ORF Transcript_12867/g.28358 Transcript_12867/m.28358 type:complete len:91 (+) Transcript_12867:356-628(+)
MSSNLKPYAHYTSRGIATLACSTTHGWGVIKDGPVASVTSNTNMPVASSDHGRKHAKTSRSESKNVSNLKEKRRMLLFRPRRLDIHTLEA